MAFALGVMVLLAATALDYAYVRYQEAVAAKLARAAGLWSVAVYVVGSVGFLSIVQGSLWFMIPECLGLYAGTALAMRRSRRLAAVTH